MTEVANETETFIRIHNVNAGTTPLGWTRHTTLTPQQLLEHFAANIKNKDVEVISVVLQGNRFNVLAAFNYDEWTEDHRCYPSDLKL